MSLLPEEIFYYQFGNQPQVREPKGRRKTYLCYKLKLLDETLDQGYFKNKVPGGLPGRRAGGANRIRRAGKTLRLSWVSVSPASLDRSTSSPSWASAEALPPADRSSCPALRS